MVVPTFENAVESPVKADNYREVTSQILLEENTGMI